MLGTGEFVTLLEAKTEQVFFLNNDCVPIPVFDSDGKKRLLGQDLADWINSPKIKELEEKIKIQEGLINKLNLELEKWTNQQKGSKSILKDKNKTDILLWSQAGVSKREIARRLKISDGTVRNYLNQL